MRNLMKNDFARCFSASLPVFFLATLGADEPIKPASEPAIVGKPKIEYGLTLGDLGNDKIRFIPRTPYIVAQDLAIAGRIAGLTVGHNLLADIGTNNLKQSKGDTNSPPSITGTNSPVSKASWEGALSALKELLGSDASETVKDEAKKAAIIELVHVAERHHKYEEAIQFLAEYATRYTQDPIVAEVLLRQGHLFRKLNKPEMAINQFYAALNAASRLKVVNLARYQRIVLMAQIEIADTHKQAGQLDEAIDLYKRLLNNPSEELDEDRVRVELVQTLGMATAEAAYETNRLTIRRKAKELSKTEEEEFAAQLGKLEKATEGYQREIIAQCAIFLKQLSESTLSSGTKFDLHPEFLYHKTRAHRALGEQPQAERGYEQFLQTNEKQDQKSIWAPWKARIAVDIANNYYQDGRYEDALKIYQWLRVELKSLEDSLKILQQIGYCHERLNQLESAIKVFDEIIQIGNEHRSSMSPAQLLILEMAQLRRSILDQCLKKKTALPTPDP